MSKGKSKKKPNEPPGVTKPEQKINKMETSEPKIFGQPFVTDLKDSCKIVNQSAILEITTIDPSCKVKWFTGKQILQHNDLDERVEIHEDGCLRRLIINNIIPEDTAVITVVCGKSISQTKINCQQKYNESVNNAFLSKLSDVDAFYGDRVVLTILLKDARWQVEWFGFNDKFGWSLINPDNSRYNIVSVGNVQN